MFSESQTYLNPGETFPANIEVIASRFRHEYERETSQISAPTKLTAFINSYIHGGEFQQKNKRKQCPINTLLSTGAILVGLSNPTELERLDQILCGHLIEKEDTLGIFGPLSGRNGTKYKPLSQCWKITIELYKMVDFMKLKEIIPEITSDIVDENRLREVLNTRSQIKKRNEDRQVVFSQWVYIRDHIINQQNEHQLPLSTDQSEMKSIIIFNRDTTNVAAQLDVGGPEYTDIILWVENRILSPLIQTVGMSNIEGYLDISNDHKIRMIEKTADNCDKRPRRSFHGVISLMSQT